MKKAEAKATLEVGTNAAKLPWPQDVVGITSMLKREGCRAIGRMDGKQERYELVLETLNVLAGHAKAKLAQQKAVREVNAVNAEAARKAAHEVNVESMNKQRKQLESERASIERRLKALKGRSPGVTDREVLNAGGKTE